LFPWRVVITGAVIVSDFRLRLAAIDANAAATLDALSLPRLPGPRHADANAKPNGVRRQRSLFKSEPGSVTVSSRRDRKS